MDQHNYTFVMTCVLPVMFLKKGHWVTTENTGYTRVDINRINLRNTTSHLANTQSRNSKIKDTKQILNRLENV